MSLGFLLVSFVVFWFPSLSRSPPWLANGLWNDLCMAILGLFASHWGVLVGFL